MNKLNTFLLNIDLEKKKKAMYEKKKKIYSDAGYLWWSHIDALWDLYMAMLFCSMEITQRAYFLTEADLIWVYLHRADWAGQEVR